jgi:hypothetical protein
MHHQDHRADAQLQQRLVDHCRLNRGGRIADTRPRAPAMPGTVDQDHPMISREHLAERLPHHLQIRAGAMDHHDRRAEAIAWPKVDDVEPGAGYPDHPALRRKSTLHGKDTGLRHKDQHRQGYHHDQCCHLRGPEFGTNELRSRGGEVLHSIQEVFPSAAVRPSYGRHQALHITPVSTVAT